MKSFQTRRTAFTLIELLVVIAIIALLVSILLPSLGKARDTARQVVCSSMIRQLAVGQMMYANSNSDYFASVSTSGYDGQVSTGSTYLNDTSSTTPTSTWDWISPIIGDSAGLSPNRAQRTLQLFNVFGCPAMNVQSTLYQDSGVPDRPQFETVLATRPFRAISFLAPASFHEYPNEDSAKKHSKTGAPSLAYDPYGTPVKVNASYDPRLDKVGTVASNKVLAADGTRYLSADQILDFDISPAPSTFGSFTDSGPIFYASTAYGKQGPGEPGNLTLSYRHPGKTINVAYFDGHAALMKQHDSWSNAAPWYPGGSYFNGTSATPESVAFHKTLESRYLP